MDAPWAMADAPAAPYVNKSAAFPIAIVIAIGFMVTSLILVSYYLLVVRCWLRAGAGPGSRLLARSRSRRDERISAVFFTDQDADLPRGVDADLVAALPLVKYYRRAASASSGGAAAAECAVCLSEFVGGERLKMLPTCSHAFHIDCIDTWLQGSARCPFCRRSVTLPPPPPPLLLPPPLHGHHGDHDQRVRRDERLCGSDSIVIEVRGERESWGNGGGGGRKVRKTAVGDEAVESRRKEEFAVEPVRRSLSMDSSCDKHKLYVSVVKEFLAQRQQVS